MQKNRAINWQRAMCRVAASALLLTALAGCASVELCEKPEAVLYTNALVFDADNAAKLAQMLQDLQAGKCRIEVEPST